MSLTNEERTILVQREYEKSLAFYSQAQANAEIGLWDVVANRLYYSLFHAVSALLIKDKHKVGTHKGAVLMFGQHYVKTGVFPAEVGRLYSQLQSMREKADYSCTWEASEADVRPRIEAVQQMLIGIRQQLGPHYVE